MGRGAQEQEVFERFRDYYTVAATSPALREFARRVLGADYQGNSYTTVDQAYELLELLELRKDSQLLDVGSGAGWPGLFVARQSGCRVVLTDIPIEGLGVANARAATEGIHARPVAASGELLPFRDRSFDAVTHSDVLC